MTISINLSSVAYHFVEISRMTGLRCPSHALTCQPIRLTLITQVSALLILVSGLMEIPRVDREYAQSKGNRFPQNKCTKFQVDSLIRSQDIVYIVLKNIFFRKTRLKFWYQFFSEKNYLSFLPIICYSSLMKGT